MTTNAYAHDWGILPKKEDALAFAVWKIGPIPVSLNAEPKSFQLYQSGIYDSADCDSSKLNHAVLVVGYTPQYWIIKNWWGSWGENGFMRIAEIVPVVPVCFKIHIPLTQSSAKRCDFLSSRSGIYDSPDCVSTKLNHAMLVVGYTPQYWIIKNWWGSWGENGYMRIVRGKNMCGIANFAAYCTIK
ncbi:hypothetical protein RP20_CCG002046 [Aedes albopictus]|nr:hypothetical protein RP20_CCG002046 [Aedes albopictus]